MTLKDLARWAVYGPLFIIPFLPIIVFGPPFLPSYFFPFITGKAFVFRICVEIALAGWVLLALLDKKYRPQFSWTFVLYGALAVWMLIADAFAVNPHKAFWSNFERMDGYVTLIHLFAFFVVSGSVFSVDKAWRKWWLWFLGVAAFVCLYGFMQIGGMLAIHQGATRVDATLGNAAYLAAYLLFGIAVALWLAIESKGWVRWYLFGLAAVEVIVLFLTATRGAILGLIGASILCAGLWLIESGKQGRRNAAILLGGLVLLVGGFFALKDAPFVKDNEVLGRVASISLSDGATRFTIWSIALKGFMERPIAGWGQEGFNYVFNAYYDPSLYAQEQWFDRAHDVFLDWLLAGGLPALLLFLALLGSGVYVLYRGGASRAERILLTGALAAYAFQAIFVFDNIMTYIPLAALLATAHGARMRPFKKLEALPVISDSAATSTVTPIIAAVLLGTLWMVNMPNMVAASDLIAALSQPNAGQALVAFKKAIGDGSFASQEIREQLLMAAGNVGQQAAVSNEDKTAFAQYAIAQMQEELKRAPNDARLHLELAVALRSFGDFADAGKEIAIAGQLSPNKPSIIIEYGATAWQAGDFKAAAQAFMQAYQLAPGFDAVGYYAAAGLIASGDVVAGEAILTKIAGTTLVDKDIIVAAYYQAKQYDKLLTLLKQRVANDNGSVASRFGLAQGYSLIGNLAAARAEIQATIKEHPEAADQGKALLDQLGK